MKKEKPSTKKPIIPAKKPPNNPDGNPGWHPSTQGYDHDGSEHTSKDR